MRIGIVGTGSVGRTLAAALSSLGHEVVVGTRDPGQTRERSEWADTAQTLVAFADVATDADLVINATGGMGSLAALEAVGAEELAGKVLLDLSNPLDGSQGFPPSLFVKDTDSLAEQIQRKFPEVRVVKSLNTTTASVMVDPASLGAETSIFVAGNDEAARARVADLLREFGWSDIIDLGDLTGARGLEMWISLWIRLYGALGTPAFNIKVVH